MPYTARHEPSLGLVEVELSGEVTAADLGAVTSRCISFQKATGTERFLIGTNELDLRVSVVDLLDIPDKQYWDEDLSRFSRIAVILPASATAQKAAHVYEMACRNRGWNARVFPDRRSALDWLGSGGK